jgi:hypothetical protein
MFSPATTQASMNRAACGVPRSASAPSASGPMSGADRGNGGRLPVVLADWMQPGSSAAGQTGRARAGLSLTLVHQSVSPNEEG